MQDTVDIDILELLSILWSNAVWIILFTTIGGLLAFMYSRYLIPPKYTASVSMYVNNSAESAATALNINDINASQRLVNTYIVILQDGEVLNTIGAQLQEEYTVSQLSNEFPIVSMLEGGTLDFKPLSKIIKMSAVNNTEVLKIEATTKNPELSSRICTIMTEIAPEVLTRVVKAGSVEVIGSAQPEAPRTSPNILQNSLIGALIGAVFSISVSLLIAVLDNTVGSEDDFKKRYNIPILGEVPDFAASTKGANKKYGGYE